MSDEVEKALTAYLDVARKILARGGTRFPLGGKSPKLAETVLRDVVSESERAREFRNLARTVAAAAPKDQRWVSSEDVSTFLRSTGVYESLYRGRDVDVRTIGAELSRSLTATMKGVTYLAPIEFVAFDTDVVLDFGDFRIEAPNERDLDRILRNDFRRRFYPATEIESDDLSEYWLINARAQVPVTDGLDEPDNSHVVQALPQLFPAPIERAVTCLALFDWQSVFYGSTPLDRIRSPRWQRDRSGSDPGEGPVLPRVPFVIEASDSLTEEPRPVVLRLQPGISFDPDTGEPQESLPGRQEPLNETQTYQFRTTVAECIDGLNATAEFRKRERFVDIGLHFLRRAFSSEAGLDQFVFSIISIDALLGDSVRERRKSAGAGGAAKRLGKRIRGILGLSEEEFGKKVTFLYEYRSDYLHGRRAFDDPESDRVIYQSDLRKAFDLARLLALWMLRFVSSLARQKSLQGIGRNQLLDAIDGSPTQIQHLPPGFPKVPSWLQP